MEDVPSDLRKAHTHTRTCSPGVFIQRKLPVSWSQWLADYKLTPRGFPFRSESNQPQLRTILPLSVAVYIYYTANEEIVAMWHGVAYNKRDSNTHILPCPDIPNSHVPT